MDTTMRVNRRQFLKVTSIVGGARVEWDFPTNHRNRAYRETELHVSDSSGFTPDAVVQRCLEV